VNLLMRDPSDCLIVALDGLGPEAALQLVDAIPQLRWVKVGLELFTLGGPVVVRHLRERGLRLFLDLKFHDIPATMAGACRSAAGLGAELITVHACAGSVALREAQQAAVAGAAAAGMESAPTLLAVTVLTSWEERRFRQELQLAGPIGCYVEHLAALAVDAGVGGCVCSPQEVAALRQLHAEPFVLVTPGIRPTGSDRGDQARVMTPVEAMAAGASRLVIGRPITAAADPAAAFASCCAGLAGG
jgi:orotidine-5'-phosphate decarboxylase